MQRRCLVVQLLPARIGGQQFQPAAGPAVEHHRQLVVVRRPHEVAAAGQLAEIVQGERGLHGDHHCTPAAVEAAGPAADAGVAPATSAGSCRPRASLAPLLGCTTETIFSSTETLAPPSLQVSW